MSEYLDVPIEEETRQALQAAGGRPVCAKVWARDGMVASMLVSDDPSKKNGEYERHISLSASTRGQRRTPSRLELILAARAIGWDWADCKINFVKGTAHIYLNSRE